MTGNDEWIAETMRCDAAMIALVAHAQGLVSHLMQLTEAQRDAVVALIAIGQAAHRYRCRTHPDNLLLDSFEHLLESLSPQVTQRLQARGELALKQGTPPTASTVERELTGELRLLYGTLASRPRGVAPEQDAIPVQRIG